MGFQRELYGHTKPWMSACIILVSVTQCLKHFCKLPKVLPGGAYNGRYCVLTGTNFPIGKNHDGFMEMTPYTTFNHYPRKHGGRKRHPSVRVLPGEKCFWSVCGQAVWRKP